MLLFLAYLTAERKVFVLSEAVDSWDGLSDREAECMLALQCAVEKRVYPKQQEHWRKGPCPQEGTLRPQWWPGGSHLGPPIPQDSALIPLCFMASRVAFSAPGFPHAVSCAALLGTYVVTHHLALLQLPSGPGMKTWLFGSYKCPQPLWSFSWSKCFSTSVDVIRKN